MSEQTNPFDEAFSSDKEIEKYKSYEETFRQKLYNEKYESTAKNLGAASYWLNAFSVGSGVIGAATVLSYLIFNNVYIMAAPALLLLTITEAGKRKTIREFFILKFGSKKTDKGLLFGLLLCLVFSLACSAGGGWYIAEIANEAKKPKQVDTKAIAAKFGAKIKQVRADKKALHHRNTYRGNTWLNANDKKINAEYIAKITELEKAQQVAITNAKNEYKTKLTEHAKGGLGYIAIALAVSLIVEGLSLFSLWFPLYFQHRSLKDKEILTRVFKPELTNWQLQEVARVLGLDLGQLLGNSTAIPAIVTTASTEQPAPAPTEQPQREIGFKNTPKSVPKRKERGTSANYELINKLLLTTALTTHQIAQKAECSDTTVRNARKKLKKEGLIP